MALLDDTVNRILVERAGDAWPALYEAGLTAIGIPERSGGAGGGLADAAAVLRAAGYHAAAVPLAETWLAGRLLSAAGLPVPPGPLTAAGSVRGGPWPGEVRAERDGAGWRLSGRLSRVPWAAHADRIALAVEGPEGTLAALVERCAVSVEPGRNLAGEPRDDITLDAVAVDAVPSPFTPSDLMLHGALARTIAMAGAARRVLDLSLRHATEREQFGRPIARFQAVQQLLAELAGEVMLLETGAEAATVAFGAGGPAAGTAVACAKADAGRAAGAAAATAHQIHGAIGVTREHVLRRLTLRLWSWRDEYGSEARWRDRVAAAMGGDAWAVACGEA
ncbi:acyl-CoA dehydrogenase family protein [Actinomadura welshii]|uniref:acyl-CoA dehydrogenase family protein n=1 Tax=Actinomadura welshii TaxID=3103817 RepID=UPI00046406D8|nr:acyl-CoA dehydrogenase family protein [Actinomadura madurae]